MIRGNIPMVVLARKGSQRFKDKNIAKLGDRTLSQIACENAKMFSSKVIYSSDSLDYLEKLKVSDVILHERSHNTSAAGSSSLEALLEVVEDFSLTTGHIGLFQPTNPIIDTELINMVIESRLDEKSTVCCGYLGKNVIDRSTGVNVLFDKNSLIFESGMFYLFSVQKLRSGILFNEDDLFAPSEHRGHTVDIDYQLDLELLKNGDYGY